MYTITNIHKCIYVYLNTIPISTHTNKHIYIEIYMCICEYMYIPFLHTRTCVEFVYARKRESVCMYLLFWQPAVLQVYGG